MFGDIQYVFDPTTSTSAYPLILVINSFILISTALWLQIPKISSLRNKNLPDLLKETELN